MSRNGSWNGMGEYMAFKPAEIRIAGRLVGDAEPLFVIAEVGLNHGGSTERALALVDAAADAGASAIKLQSLCADGLVVPAAPPPAHVTASSLREFFARFELDEDAHRRIIAHARHRGLAVMATPFSEAAVDMLQGLGVDAFKIASGDLTWTRLIARCARTTKPLVISTGMASIEEVSRAVTGARAAGATSIALLHCVSAYPVPHGSENLRAITTLAEVFDIPVGLSDHADDTFAVPMAVALGASLYERHIVLDRDDGSIDAPVSSDPAQFAALVAAGLRAHEALGAGRKECLPAEHPNKAASRRGLYAARPIKAGQVVEERDILALRPGTGLSAERLTDLVGRRSPRDVEDGTPFLESDLQHIPLRGVHRVA